MATRITAAIIGPTPMRAPAGRENSPVSTWKAL